VSSVNLHTREISIKVVYYGPGLGGKTSSLQYIHRALKADSRGQLVSLATGVDRTLYFDFLPVKLPKLRGFSVRVQLYTVPGQVHYNSTRKLVLTGADGVVFVADSQRGRLQANTESLENLVENLAEQGLALRSVPFVIQANKRDAPDAVPVADLDAKLNTLSPKAPMFESVATKGTGVFDALKAVTSLVLAELRKKGTVPSAGPDPAALASAGGVPVAIPGPGLAAAMPAAGSARRPTLPGVPVMATSEETGPMTLSSLGEVAEAIEKLTPADGRMLSGVHRVAAPTAGGAAARNLSDLVAPGSARDAVAAVEADIERGDWASAVRRGLAAFRDLASRLAGSLALVPGEAPALAALLTNLPASRYLRFREVTDREAQRGAIASADALFVLFFLADVAMRADELRK
jgi:mutual gliding-motility protein MglA